MDRKDRQRRASSSGNRTRRSGQDGRARSHSESNADEQRGSPQSPSTFASIRETLESLHLSPSSATMARQRRQQQQQQQQELMRPVPFREALAALQMSAAPATVARRRRRQRQQQQQDQSPGQLLSSPMTDETLAEPLRGFPPSGERLERLPGFGFSDVTEERAVGGAGPEASAAEEGAVGGVEFEASEGAIGGVGFEASGAEALEDEPPRRRVRPGVAQRGTVPYSEMAPLPAIMFVDRRARGDFSSPELSSVDEGFSEMPFSETEQTPDSDEQAQAAATEPPQQPLQYGERRQADHPHDLCGLSVNMGQLSVGTDQQTPADYPRDSAPPPYHLEPSGTQGSNAADHSPLDRLYRLPPPLHSNAGGAAARAHYEGGARPRCEPEASRSSSEPQEPSLYHGGCSEDYQQSLLYQSSSAAPQQSLHRSSSSSDEPLESPLYCSASSSEPQQRSSSDDPQQPSLHPESSSDEPREPQHRGSSSDEPQREDYPAVSHEPLDHEECVSLSGYEPASGYEPSLYGYGASGGIVHQEHPYARSEHVPCECREAIRRALSQRESLEASPTTASDISPRHLRCRYCGKVFKKLHQLRYHEEKHTTGDQEFYCSGCGQNFRTLRLFKAHGFPPRDEEDDDNE